MRGTLQTVLLLATVVCILANAFEVAAKSVQAPFVLQNADEVGLDRRWIPYLALLEGAAVVGLVLGLLGWPHIGMAAGLGLVLFFVGAVLCHVRSRVLHNIAFPAAFLCLAVAALGYVVRSVT